MSSPGSSSKQLNSTPPTEPLELINGLTLSPRIHLLLTIHRSDATTIAALDEWKLKQSLINFLKKTSFSHHHTITIPEEDIHIRRFKDLKNRTRHDPVARGSIFIRDLGFIVKLCKGFGVGVGDGDEDRVEMLEKKFVECRRVLVEKMDGMEANLEGVRFRVSVTVPVSDDFERLKKEWEEFFAFEARPTRGYSRSTRREPDTIILRGLPSRWFAEPRVSSKPSMLVTHTIFSTFGKIRDFHDALKVLSSRSLQKEGSRMKADYEVTWDKDGFFENTRQHHAQDRTSRMAGGHHRNEASRRPTYDSRYSPDDDVRPKRFKE